jgi:hypothetical protein
MPAEPPEPLLTPDPLNGQTGQGDMPSPAEPAGGLAEIPSRALTVREFARRWRIRPDKARAWIHRGELKAVNVAAHLCGKPRFLILPHHVADFERSRQVAKPKATPRRKRRWVTDYFSD